MLAGVLTTVSFVFDACSFSDAAFCQASPVETQQALLKLHVQSFEWFGGVFEEIRFDGVTRPSNRSCAAAGAWRRIRVSRCARITCSSRSSRRGESRARMRGRR